MDETVEKVEDMEADPVIDFQQRGGSPDRSNLNALRSRKRTKTGCLTCRKRRIKCGEERPICANCVKSKRDCEGYAPRLTFKDPMGAYPHGWQVRGYHLPPGVESHYMHHTGAGPISSQFPLIAPRPLHEGSYQVDPQPILQEDPNQALSHNQIPTSSTEAPSILEQAQATTMAPPSQFSVTTSSDGTPRTSAHNGPIEARWQPSGPVHELPPPHSLATPSTHGGNSHSQRLSSYSSSIAESSPAPQIYEPRLPGSTISPPSYIPVASHSGRGYNRPPLHGYYGSQNEIDRLSQRAGGFYHEAYDDRAYDHYQQHPAITQLHEEDEYYDVESDEEMPDADNNSITALQKKRRDLSYVLSISGKGRNLRSVEAFLHQPNILATYAPRYNSSPLMDEGTARIFCHFVTATGPLMSAYGRHPVNPALLFSGTAVPKSQQALWTYTIPMMAISNQALLHAILAVASLNIARLQQAPLTVPIKHYQYALIRVGKAVATPGKRTSMATVAATILLSQFEILSAEHSKWHSHLAGARQLLTEIDFAKWTDRIHQERARRAAIIQEAESRGSSPGLSSLEALPWIPEPGSADEKLLNKLVGTSIRKDFHGRTQTTKPFRSTQPVTEKEMDDFQTYRDLFWMYTKIDNIQSFVSGRRLLLPLDRWIHCPPRAPINRFDAVYGTLDHVALLLGRVADFAGKDVVRKRRAVKANGGVWRPAPGMFGPPGQVPSGQANQTPSPPVTGSMPSTPGQGASLQPSSTQASTAQLPAAVSPQQPPHSSPSSISSQPQMGLPYGPSTGPPVGPPVGPAAPTFNGLLPDSDQITTMPAAFTQAPRDVLYNPAQSDVDVELTEATAAAEAEWNDIQEAFEAFERSLGSAFAPLASDAGPTIDTAFGPALQYRTFQIAVCWLLFYMAKIISIRTHPHMPPASMIAAGVAAAKTAQYCNMIGRINFGLRTPAPNEPLNPIFGGAITEMMLPMFVAGVQYLDNAQRVATVERLQFIADRIGHDSAALIAAGLEKTWIRLYDAGKGPKYHPSVRVQDEYGRDLTEQQRNKPDGNGEIRVPRGPARDLEGRETSRNKNRGAVILQADTRSFAAGVMGLEDNFKGLNMDSEQPR